ncbi:unnamed protein product [marine sediment metagenome]|uniref:Uncharacterized protein n=1 Tax=marine sediment metagenome TaxID=412755 RepID=X0W2Y4_9ZZZZ
MILDNIEKQVEEDFSNYQTIKSAILDLLQTFKNRQFRYNFKSQPLYDTYIDNNKKCAFFEWHNEHSGDIFLRVDITISEKNTPFCVVDFCDVKRKYNLSKKMRDVRDILYNLIKFYEKY